MPDLRAPWLPRVLVVLLTLCGGALSVVQRIAPNPLPHYDEAVHLLQGEQFATQIRAGDALGFAFDSYRQVIWPPLHAWLVGAVFALGGTSATAGRLVSLAAYAGLAVALYSFGHELGAHSTPTQGEAPHPLRTVWCGALTAALGLGLPLTRALAGMAMTEMLAGVCLLAGLNAYLRAARLGGTGRWVLVGLSLPLVYLARPQNVIVLAATIVIERVLRTMRMRTLDWRAELAWLVPAALFVVVWFAYPAKLTATLAWYGRTADSALGPQWSPELINRLFFPLWALWWAAGGILSVYLLSGLVLSLRHLDVPTLRVAVLAALVQVGMALTSLNHQTRYILPLALALTAPSAYWMLIGIERVARLRPRYIRPIGVSLALLFIVTFAARRTDLDFVPDRFEAELGYLDAQVRAAGPVLVLGGPESGTGLDYQLLDWHLIAETHTLAPADSGQLYPAWAAEKRTLPLDMLTRLGVPADTRAALVALSQRGLAPSVPGASRTVWLGLASDAPTPATPAELRDQLAPTLAAYMPARIVVIADGFSNAYYTPDFIGTGVQLAGYHFVAQEVFAETYVTIMVYEK